MPQRLFESNELTTQSGQGLDDNAFGSYETVPFGWRSAGTVDSLLVKAHIDLIKENFELDLHEKLLERRNILDDMMSDIYRDAAIKVDWKKEVSNGSEGNGKGELIDVPFYITEEQLYQIFPRGNKAVLKQLQVQLQTNMNKYGIVNEVQLAHFLAQAGHETGGFSKGANVENLNYRSADRLRKIFPKYFKDGVRDPDGYVQNPQALANYVYGKRMGNGDETTGDGYKYRGRGVFQLTGKDNYTAFNKFYHTKHESGVDFVNNPDLIASDVGLSVESALWFFQKKVNVNDINLLTSVKKVTQKVNGGENGLSDRERIYAKALLYLVFLPRGIASVE